MTEVLESVSSEPAALDLEAIRARHFAPVKGRRAANMWTAHDDLTALIAEVERLRPQISVFGLSRWQQKVLIEEVDLRTAEMERLRGEVERERAAVVAWLRCDAEDYSRAVKIYHPATALWDAALCIELGEHRREGGE